MLTWPASDTWSPAFKKAHEAHMAVTRAAPANFGLPAMSAPKRAWEEWDAAFDAALVKPLEFNQCHFDVVVERTMLGGVGVAVVTPAGGVAAENRQRVLVNLHGFAHGLSQGLAESMPIAGIGKCKVVVVDYRLEPEYAYPASSDDAIAVYRELLTQYSASAIGIFGSSGGGVLTSQVVAWIQAKGLPRPGAVGIFWSGLAMAPYPWGKLGDSAMWGLRAMPGADRTEADELHADLARAYMGDVKPDDPLGYPGSSDAVLSAFPPTLFLSGTRAIDMSASIVSHARLLKLGIDSSLYLMEGGWHGANLGRTEDSPEEHDANSYIAKWFAARL